MSKNIYNYNSKGQLHGYQEIYCNSKLWFGDNELFFKGFYHNGVQVDYEELYSWGGGLSQKVFYI